MNLYPEAPEAVRSMLRRGTGLQFDDSGTLQFVRQMRGLAGERPQNVVRFQDYGLSSHPPANAEGLLAALGGRSDRLVAMMFQHRDKRPRDLPEGGTALYDADGKIIRLIKEKLEIDAGGKPVVIHNATTVTVEASTDVAVGIAGKRYVRIREGRVDLAVKAPGDEAPFKVVTESGPSAVVWARLD